MKVKCIDNKGVEGFLTVGKIYSASESIIAPDSNRYKWRNGEWRIMAKLNPRKQDAIEFIKQNKGKMKQKEIMRIASRKFGYSEATIRDLIYRSGNEVKNEKLTLREKLEILEKRNQEAYEKRIEMKVKNRPKIRIEV